MTGLASDGGLFLPNHIPDVRRKLDKWAGLSYSALACEIFRLFCDIPSRELKRIVAKSYSTFNHPGTAPLKSFSDYYLLELFHGPTLAFKDFALQFLGNLFEYFLRNSKSGLNLVAATSGDTGSAAIAGVKGKKNIRIFVLYPFGRVSPAQELQMTTALDKNVFCLAVKGSFDDCQNVVKGLLSDLDFRAKFGLGAVNSINWARILAQIVYYFHAYFQVRRLSGKARVDFAVPTGNFGDIFAAYFARRMGLPIARLILATNQNRILSDFFEKGVYKRGLVRQTLSPSMDIQVASNFERYLYYRLGENPGKVRSLMAQFARDGKLVLRDMGLETRDTLFAAASADIAATLSEIRRCYRENGYVLDPHTAVGVHAARKFMSGRKPMVCLATAHPAKFESAVKRALGRDFARCREQVFHPALESLKKKKTRRFVLPADIIEVRKFIVSRVQGHKP